MGEVIIKYKIMPESPETDLEAIISKLSEHIPSHVEVAQTKTVPIAFGLKYIEAIMVMEDKMGGGDAIEEGLKGIPGVSSVEVLEQGLK